MKEEEKKNQINHWSLTTEGAICCADCKTYGGKFMIPAYKINLLDNSEEKYSESY